MNIRVSIPNGMEFYDVKGGRAVAIASFNSQRDGILQKNIISCVCEKRCFNSQRDGILLSRIHKLVKVMIVSIPNGMEFYNSLIYVEAGILCVSIPNGMEFYITNRSDRLNCMWFQFPTGWNSTIWKFTIMLEFISFNSQRDGILLRKR